MDTVRLPSILRKRTDSFLAGVAELRFQLSELGSPGLHSAAPQGSEEASEHVARDGVKHGYGEPERQPLTKSYAT